MDVSAAVKMGVDAVLGAGVGFGAVLGIDEGVSIGTGVVSVWVRGDFHLSAFKRFLPETPDVKETPYTSAVLPCAAVFTVVQAELDPVLVSAAPAGEGKGSLWWDS